MIDFVTFGVIVDDIVFPDGQTRMGVLGGGGPQTAWGMAAALGSGTRVGLAAGVGDDLGADTLDPLRAAGINLDGVRLTDQPTPRAWQVMELGSLAFARALIEKGRRVSLEPFKPPDQPLDDEAIRAMLSACQVFSPNWIEAVRLVQSDDTVTILDRLHALGGHTLALRRGADGADVWNLDAGRGVHVSAVQTEAVDVVGAGNAFCGALVARLDEGIESAACHASAAASYMIEQVGMPAALPDPADYARRLDEVRAGLREIRR
jgi:sugar/nucleoside kinase (ribokinase family)